MMPLNGFAELRGCLVSSGAFGRPLGRGSEGGHAAGRMQSHMIGSGLGVLVQIHLGHMYDPYSH